MFYCIFKQVFSPPQISWIRMRDWYILTNGARTYTSDSRFTVLHKEGTVNLGSEV